MRPGLAPKFQIWDVFELALQPGLRIGSDCILLPGDVILKETPGFPNGLVPPWFDSRSVHRLIDCTCRNWED